MSQAFEIAGVGLSTQQRALDIIANNIANINTPAFKRSNVQFSEMISRGNGTSLTAALGQGEDASTSVAGVRARARMTLGEQGQIEQTRNALDIAIDGQGFIELMGPGGQSLLWRGGRLSLNADGQLANEAGLALRAMITAPYEMESLQIGADGRVVARLSNGETEDLGDINLVRLEDMSALERLDGGLYRLADGARLIDAVPGEDGAGRIVQGGVEHSNVDLNDEMVQLMIVQRAYGANAQIVQAADQLMSIANNLRR